ncbi:MAG: FAD-binding protein [Thermoplasmata archaeon]|nr:FAD-binding protein [Thermoplasmata archaeon]
MNPFDARALQVAHIVRRTGDSVVAISMGPPLAEVVLREALAAGVDRAILVSDPELSGSDAQVTSRVLFRALSKVRPGLVIMGARSSDAETGQVPPEIAARLGWPLVASARSLARIGSGGGFQVTADGREGWVRWEVETPFVLSTGEKIAKPPKPTDAERAEAALRGIERWDLSALGLSPNEAGGATSPTLVRSVRRAARHRVPAVFRGGDPSELVTKAFDHLATISVTHGEPRLATEPNREAGRARTAWIVAIDELGGFDPAALAMVAAVRRALPNTVRTLVVPGPVAESDQLSRIGDSGAANVLVLPKGAGVPGAADVAGALRAAARPAPPDWGLLVADPFGREVAGRWSAGGELGLIGDAMGLAEQSDGSVHWSKPAFGGNFEAWITGNRRPTLVTVRPGVFPSGPGRIGGALPSITIGPPIEPTERSAQRVATGGEDDPRFGSLEGAERIVTVGMGIGGPDGIEALVPYLGRWGAALGATRRVVDAGWVPVHRQVGLTGRSLAPDLAILLGVGKAHNHVVGLRRAGHLIAVNPDPEAPVFQLVDAGIVAAWREALPALDARLTRRDPARPEGPG